MAALTQDAWREDRYSQADETPTRHRRRTAARRDEMRDAAIRFIQSQIGIGALAVAGRAQDRDLVDF